MNNFDLKTIQLPIQQIVNAIASVLKIEIEVADKHLFRVAGTGQIKSQIWKEMNGEDLIYKRCIQTKQTIVIENPGFNSFCSGCLHFGHCKEHGEICCPIILDGEAIGVIGLIAFDKIQQQRLFTHKVENIAFLEQIAQIIATKMQETKFYKNYIVSQKKYRRFLITSIRVLFPSIRMVHVNMSVREHSICSIWMKQSNLLCCNNYLNKPKIYPIVAEQFL
ncbi:GAF domain-containing protein [Rummeliibacillus sp. SL167]|uniref:GAF domain-containing protein n=1 Tax=Rummeliibacillus sp. SL167 TaxID=2579792 RepID=UPI0011B83C75|nr:GAF domain-containing protein [Rummeliibacillus sp. SL167]